MRAQPQRVVRWDLLRYANPVSIQALIQEAAAGRFGPVHVIVGSERFLMERAVQRLRAAVIGDGPTGFNDEVLQGRGLSAQRIVDTARTLPMMAAARLVLVRDAEAMDAKALDTLADYLEEPCPTTCLILVAEKLDGRQRLVKQAKKHKMWFEAAPLRPQELRSFALAEAKGRGHRLEPTAAEALLDAVGNDLAALDDGLERLSLFVGAGATIDTSAVEACITRIKVESIWSLVDAVGARDARTALHAASSLLADREPPLRILALVTRQLRILARMGDALAAGQSAQEAARSAGAPPFKAQALAQASRRFGPADQLRAVRILANTDLALKGSKRPPDTILQEAVLALCRR